MSDLISRKALIQRFWRFTNGGKQRYLIPEEIWEMVELAPTAYDIDKVVEQLGNAKDEFSGGTLQEEYYWRGINKAIEIVKKGGAV